jgi:hypothetical protein
MRKPDARASGIALNANGFTFSRAKERAGGLIVPMSAEECRANAEKCDQMAESLGPDNAPLREVMREVAAQWRRLAADAEARRCNPLA